MLLILGGSFWKVIFSITLFVHRHIWFFIGLSALEMGILVAAASCLKNYGNNDDLNFELIYKGGFFEFILFEG